MKKLSMLLFAAMCMLLTMDTAQAQSDSSGYANELFSSVEWREVGPFRGGRSAAVTGVEGKPNLFYMGATGGGVWRTKDGGQTWENISDSFFGGSIGAVEVAKSDINVIYVGGGEVSLRGNVSSGYGMYKSVDAGKTWQHIGLENSRHIPRVRVHPTNPDLVYAAVLGDLYKSSADRGVYRSKDGGENWEKVLHVNDDAGIVDLVLDPNNSRIMYASSWRVRRTPYRLDSGGEGSGLWKSTDGGNTWTEITDNKGLPTGTWGINGVTVSPVNSDRVWVIVENEDGGVYRSDDAGETWKKVNSSRALRQRAWYYSRIYADTQDENKVYVMNVSYHRSSDGGRTFESFNAPHGDHHDLWIAPEDNQRMIIGDDGGAQVSFDGGENWSTYHNQPTAQFYRVTTDNHFPYRIYAAQQDNSTVRIAHRTDGFSIGERDWEPTAGGESAHIAVDPTNNDIVFGGSYGGFLTRVNHWTKQTQAINVWPDNPMGYGAEGMRFRFQWNFPIFFSPHDPNKLYTTSNQMHVSYNGGQSWDIISPDLTRNDSIRMLSSGGPITQDNTGVEYYCTIFAACESPYEKDLLWAGSDDGLIHISKDAGESWTDVSPDGMPEWMMINSIDPDPFTPGGAYVAGTRYKLGDDTPYLYKTKDYGASWSLITSGIEEDHFTRVVRADPQRKGTLYAGTESGMYISFDDGANWQPLQLNLPMVPITDLTVKRNNLIAATQGRSLWMIDDLTVFHQLEDDMALDVAHLYQPMNSYRMNGGARTGSKTQGTNHPGGVTVHYYLPTKPEKEDDISLTFYEANGDSICTYSTKAEEKEFKLKDLKAHGNTFRWNMRYPGAKDFEGRIFWAGGLNGPMAVPGVYKVKLRVGEEEQEHEFNILPDPRSSSTEADFIAQFDFIQDVNGKVTEAHEAIIEIRDVRDQINNIRDRMEEDESSDAIIVKAEEVDSVMTEIEKALYQTKNQSRQDPLNFPIRLTNKLAHVNSINNRGNFKPTKQSYEVKEELTRKIDDELAKYYNLKANEIPELNRMVRESAAEAIMIKKGSDVN